MGAWVANEFSIRVKHCNHYVSIFSHIANSGEKTRLAVFCSARGMAVCKLTRLVASSNKSHSQSIHCYHQRGLRLLLRHTRTEILNSE